LDGVLIWHFSVPLKSLCDKGRSFFDKKISGEVAEADSSAFPAGLLDRPFTAGEVARIFFTARFSVLFVPRLEPANGVG